jgi:glycosyltransferase involved in cell wall biosynthesis
MKIGIHTQYYPPEIGAPQARLSELARRFVDAGDSVTVLTAFPNYPRGKIYEGYKGLYLKERIDGVTVLRAPLYPTKSIQFTKRLSSYFSFVGSSALIGAAAMPKVDFLITESPPLFLGISGYGLAKKLGARWIFNVSDLWPSSAVDLGVVSDGASLRAAEKLEALCYRFAWCVTGQSRETVADIRKRFPEVETFHLSNGVDTDLFGQGERDATERQVLGANDDDVVALYAGLHGIAQGLEQILEAASKLKHLKNLKFVFVGDGPEKSALLNLADNLGLEQVQFMDPLTRDRMPSLLSACDISIVPLKKRIHGAVPSKLYEAMGAAKPVVLVANGEPSDIVNQTGAGIAIAPGDIDQIAEAFEKLAETAALRKSMGQKGREAALLDYDRSIIFQRFRKRLLEELT